MRARTRVGDGAIPLAGLAAGQNAPVAVKSAFAANGLKTFLACPGFWLRLFWQFIGYVPLIYDYVLLLFKLGNQVF